MNKLYIAYFYVNGSERDAEVFVSDKLNESSLEIHFLNRFMKDTGTLLANDDIIGIYPVTEVLDARGEMFDVKVSVSSKSKK